MASTGLLASSACGRLGIVTAAPRIHLPKVRVEEDRLIRSVAGLRPYRRSGFVLRAEKLDDALLIHNYGHGGAGITLSWGCALLAADIALQSHERSCAVIGAGAVGLTTARVLQDRGFDVTIYTRDLPPDTTSNIAGGQWGAYTLYEDAFASPEFMKQFEAAARASHQRFQALIGARYGVRWIQHFVLSDTPPVRASTDPIADLQIDSEMLPEKDHPFKFRYVRRYYSMLVETSTFLDTLTNDFYLHGGKLVVRTFDSVAQLAALRERIIVNCTGLGSRKLIGDLELTPVRGQLAVLLPQPEINYVMMHNGHYMFPRSDGILLGGTRESGVWSSTPDPQTTHNLIKAHADLMATVR